MTSGRFLWIAGVALAAAACQRTPPPHPAPAVPTLPAQYLTVKTVIASLADAERALQAEPPRAANETQKDDAAAADLKPADLPDLVGKTVDLMNCRRGDEFLGDWGKDDPTTARLADLAYDVWFWTKALAPFPRTVWAPLLDTHEAAEAERLLRDTDGLSSYTDRAEALEHTIAYTVNDATRGANPPAKRLVVEGGCGAGEFPVSIVSEPRGAQITFIPVFFYELCRAQHMDPDNPAQCTRWREAIDGKLTPVSGDYMYTARWADGSIRRGKLSFTDAGDNTGPFDERCQCHLGQVVLAKPK